MTSYCRINQLVCIELSGKESALFLQGQITIDTKKLAEGQWRRFAYCSRQGKILTNGIIAKTESTATNETFILLICTNIADRIVSSLKKFILRAKVEIKALDYSIFAIWEADKPPLPIPLGIGAISQSDNMIVLEENKQSLVLLSDATLLQQHPKLQATTQMTTENLWWAQEINRGIAWIDEASYEEYIPQHINIELVGSIDFTKGCFVGQEVIARLQHLGEIKKRAIIVSGPIVQNTLPLSGQKLMTADNKPAGQLVNVVKCDEQSFIALASTSTASHDKALLLDGKEVSFNLPPYSFPKKEKLKRTL